MKYLSVCIPTYEMRGEGEKFLRHSFNILAQQTFTDFEVVISDHSRDEAVAGLCREFADRLDIKYYRYHDKIGSSSTNLNNCIRQAQGRLIKILFQDDFLYHREALADIVAAFDIEKDAWLITACEHSPDGVNFYHPFYPRYNRRIHLGKNTISSPSVLTIKNDRPLLFDENLIWLMDVDYYKRCYDAYGPPKTVRRINVVNRTGQHQVSAGVDRELDRRERRYVIEKFSRRKAKKLALPQVTLVAVSSIKLKETATAIKRSLAGIDFGKTLMIGHERPATLPAEAEFIPVPRMTSKDDYSRFMLYDLARHIKTEFALVIQYDGYVVRPERWREEFLNYDYIGAPWPEGLFRDGERSIRVGNGGFSLRSQKLLNSFSALGLPFDDRGHGHLNEDGMICHYYRRELEQAGIRFAPPEVAARFSRELKCRETVARPFGFHKNKAALPLRLLIQDSFLRLLGRNKL